METKTTRFLTQFSRAVFQQWTQTPEHEQFWNDEAFIHSVLTDGVAKLPLGKLKAELVRNLKPLETQLIALLRDLHVDYAQKNHQEEKRDLGTCGALLNEELTELELTQAATATCTDKQRRLTGVLALDVGVDIVQHSDMDVDNADELVRLYGLIAARNFETFQEQEHKRGQVLKRLATWAKKSVDKLCTASGNWSCADDDACQKGQQLRELLEHVVVQDVVALARVPDGDGSLKAPWTMFYRPENKELKKVSYDSEMAKIYAVLLTLAVYFPIIEHDEEEEEETSYESSSSSSSNEELGLEKKKLEPVRALDLAQLTTRQVLFAAQMRQQGLDQNNQWLVLVLSFVQSLRKPTTYLDDDGGEALDYQSRRELLDCVGGLYTRAFASAALFDQAKETTTEEKTAVQDRSLFEAIVCLRHAAHFMRVERKSSLPAITTAMAQLAGVALPASFVSWLDHEQILDPKSVLEKATQRLWKKCIGQNRMANILLSSTDVSDEEMPLIQKNYLEHLDRLAVANADKSSRQADAISAEAAEVLAVDAGSLFYVDNAGGEDKEKMSKLKKKRANKKKKRANKTGEAVPAKRSRASSN